MTLTEFFKRFAIFDDREIEAFVPLFTVRHLKKGASFIREGTRCTEVAFIETGIFRSYYAKENGEEVTYCFRFPGDLLGAYSSFITGDPGLETLCALSDASLLVIQKKDLDRWVTENPKWMVFLKVVAEQQYLELENRIFQLLRETAAERYAYLLRHHPIYIQQIPLHYLASFLGITQRHLSRIRKEITF
ncbi:Crp/Fnr family transcriptional regulator [Sphingobacterium psychroaquaticum]|uniref:cAMP-binding domain of CRP or a regulatory subunit of cAMP-dependent protein kinases n=1 Tax=Sphingobacterium psychroaquaticum TaxID=561061 RepID=A0A1X7I1M2_9SPHI|nr:Crp/Fnr family transcriptional regulator [Sphingobacterium psychroaquaticum]SMG07887.1 cAMP-binding domain of CRP or a regulatory subunit of cAMP-dependent protein kinases [Sphingobacterium psychroaquaticum]